MKKHTYQNYIDCLNLFMIFLLMAGLALYYTYQQFTLGKAAFYPYYIFAMAFLPLLLMLIRNKSKNQGIRIGIHAFMPFLVLLLLPADKNTKTWCTVIAICICIFSFYQMANEQRIRKNIPLLFILILIPHLMAASTKGDEEQVSGSFSPELLMMLLLLCAVCFIILYLINLYLSSFHQFLRYHVNISDGFFKQMRRSNLSILVVFIAACVVFMLLFSLLPFGYAKQGIMAIIRTLLLGIYYLISHYPNTREPSGNEKLGEAGSLPEGQLNDSSPLVALIPMLVVLLLIAGIIVLIMNLYKKSFATYRTETDVAEFVSPFDTKKSQLKTPSILKLFGNSNAELIRKYYYKTIEKNNRTYYKKHKRHLSVSQTPQEWNRSLSADITHPEDLKALTTIYEKARYSNLPCTQEDVDKAKKASTRSSF